MTYSFQQSSAARQSFWVLVFCLLWVSAGRAEPVAGVTNFYQHSDQLATGGLVAPSALTQLKAQGYIQIIDLRQPEEGTASEAKAAQSLGLVWHGLPTSNELPSAEQLAKLGDLLQNGKTLVHCRSGNRVGMSWALLRASQGVALETALAEGRAMGMKATTEARVRAQLSVAESAGEVGDD